MKKLREIGTEDGKAARERLSGLSRFLAAAYFIHKEGASSISLKVDSDLRREFQNGVGDVVRLSPTGIYTSDFYDKKSEPKDFGVSSNFLTTGLALSRGTQRDYPSRPGALLKLDNEVVSLHPEFKENLISRYSFEEIRIALCLWLVRSKNFQDSDMAKISQDIQSHLKSKYGNEIGQFLCANPNEIESFLLSVQEPLSDQEPDLIALFAPETPETPEAPEAPEGRGNGAAQVNSGKRAGGGENVIYYGAPGTGKSHQIQKVVENEAHVVRTVFHPDLQNSDFFGGLKPQMRSGELCYDFVPGPFMEALKLAYCNPGEMVYLVIEELNRAAAAAVFGDLFLLLDRNEDGASDYDVSFPTAESREWFETATSETSSKLKLPSNLTIYATMNSADQGVFPLDTAFRRRWRQEYMHLDYQAGPEGHLKVVGADGTFHEVEWRKFVECLNGHLLKQDDLALAEDRLLGQWFVKPGDLKGSEIPGKILLYLWDDLLRHGGRDRIFRPEFKTYGSLFKAIGNAPIFCDGFLKALNLQAKIAEEDEDQA
ncbi:AAA family ATPase [Sedimentimonas flavescens]|uniref:AAA family ATPase n=1 Tax=Sedimentimonas flavescens TaxID=2851012 RepID=A0ABT3A2X8_9RHOB|nr:AAA family ATPase [Sedimentimonas flavescens]MCV2880364.1 AAA family ATPase [Sedimentimonas flavescens]